MPDIKACWDVFVKDRNSNAPLELDVNSRAIMSHTDVLTGTRRIGGVLIPSNVTYMKIGRA